MKRAVFMWMLSWSLAVVCVVSGDAQSKKTAENSASKKSGSETAKQKSAAGAPTEKTSSSTARPNSSQADAPNTTAGRNDNQGSKAGEPPRVKVLDITRLDDLHVQVTISLNDAAKQNAATFSGISGSINLDAQFDNGQVATAIASVGTDTRRLTLELRPVTPNPNAGAPINPVEFIDKTGGKGGSGSPANSGGNKEKGSVNPTARRLNTVPRLTKATAKLFFNLKGGERSTVITDELSRKF